MGLMPGCNDALGGPFENSRQRAHSVAGYDARGRISNSRAIRAHPENAHIADFPGPDQVNALEFAQAEPVMTAVQYGRDVGVCCAHDDCHWARLLCHSPPPQSAEAGAISSK